MNPTATNAAIQQLSSWGANSISRVDISDAAAVKNPRESSGKLPEPLMGALLLRLAVVPTSMDHSMKILITDENWELVKSLSLGASALLSSPRYSVVCKSCRESILWSKSAICSAVKVGIFATTSLPKPSASEGDAICCTLCTKAAISGSVGALYAAAVTLTCAVLSGRAGAGGCILESGNFVCCTFPCNRSSIFWTESLSFKTFGPVGGRPKL
mmetsp:Transcript_45358/g.105243  ORF Transcript_45358/g.105243 Transcript_45358/m.105243 type:complete len:214 (+) Transcript_45358:989-1630(+)